MKNLKGAAVLLVAALIWGLAFVAQTSAADSIGAFTFNAARSAVATLFLLSLLLLRRFLPARTAADNGGVRTRRTRLFYKRELIGGAMCGAVLFTAINLQQFGIAAYPPGAAASGRAGFITATYVIMVAVYALLTGGKPHPAVLAATAVCVGGMWLLCLSEGIGGVYLGDALVLACAVGFTAQILVVDRFASLDCIALSCVQFFTCGVLSFAAMLLFEEPSLKMLADAALPILYTGILSSGVAYTLQFVGQRYAEPAVTSIVMSLESVFAALFGWMLLGEKLNGRELAGCALVFASVLLAQLPDVLAARRGKNQRRGE